MKRLSRGCVMVIFLLLVARPAAAELTAEHLLLVVNKRIPEGRQLAEFYAAQRGVPNGRIVELDIPADDTLPRDQFEPGVVQPIRAFLNDNALAGQVRCIVTFYGVPLKVGPAMLTADEALERQDVDAQAESALAAMQPGLQRAIATAQALRRPVPNVNIGTPLQNAVAQLELAQRQINAAAQGLSQTDLATVGGAVDAIRQMLAQPPVGTEPLSPAEVEQFREAIANEAGAADRAVARDLGRRAGPLDHARTLASHQRRLDVTESHASFDSELATLWQDNPPTARWLPNPLAGRLAFEGQPSRPMMTIRLDGPSIELVRKLIEDSIATEAAGLTGSVVVDSRGLQLPGPGEQPDGYSPFDDQLRRLVGYLRENTELFIRHDDGPEIILRANNRPAAEDVALYVGWYRLRKYESAFEFNRGAVGFHVASLEMLTLHGQQERGWVPGLLKDGIVATLGATAEPYLSSFPAPLFFFPLLLTGELTLAEVYWSTNPMTSWQIGLIGDPLYKPYKVNPPLSVDKLPPQLQAIVEASRQP